jgi:hypothetical protein
MNYPIGKAYFGFTDAAPREIEPVMVQLPSTGQIALLLKYSFPSPSSARRLQQL